MRMKSGKVSWISVKVQLDVAVSKSSDHKKTRGGLLRMRAWTEGVIKNAKPTAKNVRLLVPPLAVGALSLSKEFDEGERATF
jgi:hypothetical protein